MIIPTEIKRIADPSPDKNGLEITWSDGIKNTLFSEVLRKNCPCAVCKEKRGDDSHSQPLTPKKSMLKVVDSSKEEELKLEKIWQVGQYAVGLLWGDGHQTGIYTFQYLRELAEKKLTT